MKTFAGLTSVNIVGRTRSRPTSLPPRADWMCSMCRLGEHDSCLGLIKICFCPVCWMDEDAQDDEVGPIEERLLDGNLTSATRLW